MIAATVAADNGTPKNAGLGVIMPRPELTFGRPQWLDFDFLTGRAEAVGRARQPDRAA
jgi:hypothetical protein